MAALLWPRAAAALDTAIAARVFPGAVVEVGRRAGPVATLARGAVTYAPDAAPAGAATVYDLASLTKVLATTALAAAAFDAGLMRAADPVRRFIDAWSGADRGAVTIQDLLEHASGLAAHRPYFETLRGRDAIARAICAEPLEYAPRTRSVYSDAGFMLLGFALERAAGAPLDQCFDAWRDGALGAGVDLRFRPDAAWRRRTAPTEVPEAGVATVGVVHDENAAALDGVAGHAGLFGTAAGVGACARWWMSAPALPRFSQRSTVPGSSRALGWDTMRPTSSCGTRLSPAAIGHTGFTGTSLWIDPSLDLYVVMLTNRVHPTRAGEGIQDARRALHDAVVLDLNG